ncbi:MAG: hypothetical protein ACJA1A_000135 [Saprospiraceae bacterium]|jgi:hypothetical protein
MKNLLLGFIVMSIISCTKDYGKVEVTYQEATAIYGDIEAIRSQPLNETIREITNPGKIYLGNDVILIGEEQEGIHVIDNSDPINPTSVNFINIPGNKEFFVKDNKIYAETYYDLVKIDISDMYNAVLDSRAEYVFQDLWKNGEQTLIGFSYKEVTTTLDQKDDFYQQVLAENEIYLDYAKNIIPKSALPSSFAGSGSNVSGTANRVTYTKEHVYIIGNNSMYIVADHSQGLKKVDSKTNIGDGVETIFPFEDNLYIGSRSAVNIFNISDPKQPIEAYEFEHATACDPVLPADGVAYVTLRTADFSACPGNTNSLLVLDTRDIYDVEQKKEIAMSSPFGMTIIGDDLYIGEGDNGLKIFDISNKYEPELKKSLDNIIAYDVIPHPTISNLILTTGLDGVSQYMINDNGESLTLQSSISY